MCCIVCIRLSEVRQNSEVSGFGYAEPGSLLFALEIAGGENGLVVRGPPVWAAGGAEDEFVAVVEDYEGVKGVGGCYEDDAHFVVSKELESACL